MIGNHPNPFNPSTTISFDIAQTSSFVTLEIFNIKGQKVRILVDGKLDAGNHSVIWNGKDNNNKSVSSGIYFAVFDVDDHGSDYTSVKKLILLK